MGFYFTKTLQLFAAVVALYCNVLCALTNPVLQRFALYANFFHTAWWYDNNIPEQFGFAKSQVTPFKFNTPDNETLYAWHVLPLGLYAEHESELLREPSGCAEDITKSRGFRLLLDDPGSLVVISFHGNAGSVADGWRTDAYRSISDGNTSRIHIIAMDYRGFGYSSGSPTEEGLITDGITTVRWALMIAKIPPEKIVIIGHSLGTAVATAVLENFAKTGIEFAGAILVSGFADLPSLLTSYSLGGFLPLFSPLGKLEILQKWYQSFIKDKWCSAFRLTTYVRISNKVRLFIIHARDDHEIPYTQSDRLFLAAVNATTSSEMDSHMMIQTTARNLADMGDSAFIRTWKAGENKIIQEQIIPYGGHKRIITYAPIALAVLKAFDLEENGKHHS